MQKQKSNLFCFYIKCGRLHDFDIAVENVNVTLLCIYRCVQVIALLSHFHFETSVLFSKVIWNTVSLFITTISITTTLCIKTTININTNIIIAIITTSIYFITAISFALTITTIYIIITTIITTTPSFIIIIIISITAKKFSLLLLSLWVQWHFSTSASCNLTSFLFNVVLNFQNFQLKMFLVC